MEQAESDQWGAGREIMVEREGRGWTKSMYEWPTDVDNSVGIVCGSRQWDGHRRAKGEYWDICNRIIMKKNFLEKKLLSKRNPDSAKGFIKMMLLLISNFVVENDLIYQVFLFLYPPIEFENRTFQTIFTTFQKDSE